MRKIKSSALLGALLIAFCSCPSLLFAQGIMLPTVGPVNRGMGGAGVAAPTDAIGAVYWNPASIGDLPASELSVGLGLLLPTTTVNSSVNGIGSGSTESDSGATPRPTIGWVHQSKNSPFTLGFGIVSVAGFKTNFPASTTNPVFTPQPNVPGTPGGFGRVFAEAQFLELLPVISMDVTDKLSIGGGPTITAGQILLDPFVFAAPDDADGSGAARYPDSVGSQYHWGGGFQLGAYYKVSNSLRFGFNFKSPQWMEDFRFNTTNELGFPRAATAKIDLPMILVWGTSFKPNDDLLLAVDLRYLDYDNTDGFRQQGFNSDGSVAGLGWRSVFSVATGMQMRLTDFTYLRAGYTYQQNPIPNENTVYNIGDPLYYENVISVGASHQLGGCVWLNAAYSYFFKTDITGPIVTPAGQVPGSSVTSKTDVHFLSVGLTVRY